MVKKNDSAQQEPKKEIIRSVRYTPAEDAVLDAKCTTCGLPKSVLIHDTSLGYDPPQLMTDGQEEAENSPKTGGGKDSENLILESLTLSQAPF